MALGARRRIGIMAPASPVAPELAARVVALNAERLGDAAPELVFHPQCFLSDGHFAGADAVREDALVELANDPSLDAVWAARGGYGAARIAEGALNRFTDVAHGKRWLAYSDGGALLAGLQARGYANVAHGSLPADLNREGGEAAVERALRWLALDDPSGLEPAYAADPKPTLAFNIAVLSSILGTPLEPRCEGRVLMLEEVSEHLYAIDRYLFQITSTPAVRTVAGVRLGRFNDIPQNDRPFGETPEAMMCRWCARSGIPYLWTADIGHDAANRIVPFS
ncbi:muramoyltetrapeptide carboxypeptidase [soil metagenome]